MADDTIARRRFLVGAGLAGTAVATGLAPDAAAGAQDLAASTAVAAADAKHAEPRRLLNETEHAFVVAAVDTMIPADELSPSGSECGVAVYIISTARSRVPGAAVPESTAPGRI